MILSLFQNYNKYFQLSNLYPHSLSLTIRVFHLHVDQIQNAEVLEMRPSVHVFLNIKVNHQIVDQNVQLTQIALVIWLAFIESV